MAIRKIKIALIEDSVTVRIFYKKILASKGFHVLEAETGGQGLEIIKGQSPDIIVLDMLLPDMHGLDVLKIIKSDDQLREIPVMVLTSVKDMVLIQNALQAGANHYSVKGSDSPAKFLDIIYKLLKRVQERQRQNQSPAISKSTPDEDTEKNDEDEIEFL